MNNWEKYFYPGTDIFINKLNIHDFDLLRKKEYEYSIKAFYLLERSPEIRTLNMIGLQQIHKRLFGNLYDWAGKLRDVDMRKNADSPFFITPKQIFTKGEELFYFLKRSNYFTNYNTKEQFLRGATELLDNLNQLHPFREGNGRTQKLFLNYIAGVNGYRFNYDRISKEDWNKAFTSMGTGFTDGIYKVLSSSIYDISREERNMYRRQFGIMAKDREKEEINYYSRINEKGDRER